MTNPTKPAISYKTVAIDAVIKKFNAKKRKMFSINSEVKHLGALIDRPPTNAESYKMISAGGFSSIAFINYIAERESIKVLYASTLAIGKKHINILDQLCKSGKIINATFLVCSIFKQTSASRYGYYECYENICKKNGWRSVQAKNHSKIILMETDKNKYVVETSSNLNENPKIEQFTFENDPELYGFYKEFFEAVVKNAKDP